MSVYNVAVKYLQDKYAPNVPVSEYTPTDANIKLLLGYYYLGAEAKKDLKTAMDYVWLWKASRTYETFNNAITNVLKDYNTVLTKFKDRIVEINNEYVKIKYRDVIFKVYNIDNKAVLYGAFECFDCLGNSFGDVRYLDIPEAPEGEIYV